MSLFQKSVLNKYYSELSIPQIQESFLDFQSIFNNPAKQQNILNAKEEQYQEGFLRELFVKILGYTLYPDGNHNLITEQKNVANSKKADGAILNGLNVIAVIELKSTKTVDLASIESQAFGYKNNQQECKYVITSNFKKLRFYIDNAVEFLEFDLFNLNFDDFKLLWVCLSANYLLKNIPAQIKEASNHQEEKVTKQLYADYAKFRTDLFNDICNKNTDYDRLFLFKKTQKLLDRFLFLFFAEDRGLVAPNWTRKILQDWTDLKDRYDNYIPLYTRFRKNFDYLNTGYHGKDGEIFAYNGGLFAPDEVLDSLTIDDDLLYNGSLELSNYDFESEVDVNILGHIFEHSLNEIDEIQASLEENKVEKVTKRKKDGVFYTPKYITKYIVENTIGVLCKEQKEKLEIIEEDFEFIDAKAGKKLTDKRKALNQKIDNYRNWLLDLKIVDPACGSGAFLNQALEFLIAEHSKLDELRAKLLGGSLVLSDVETSILENNLYGVDLNEEAVEIAKLSLWLRTARKGRKLNSLNNNLKCGNSLIDDVLIAGDKAFNWNLEFKEVFDKGGFHVVIGNPPYVPTEYISESEKKYLEIKYKSAFGRINLFPIFYEKGIDILKDKGMLAYITPYTLLKNQYFKSVREYILSNTLINTIIDFTNNIVFKDAAVDSIIVVLTKSTYIDNTYDQITNIKDFVSSNFTITKVKQNEILCSSDLSLIVSPFDKIIKRLSNECIKMESIIDFKQGIITGGNSKFITTVESGNTERILTGSDFNRYSSSESNKFIIYDIKNLHRPRTREVFEINEKILLRQTSSYPICTLDTNQTYTLDTVHNGKIIDKRFKIKFILAILNSKLIRFLYENSINESGKVFAQVKIIYIDPLPVKFLNQDSQTEFEKKVDSIINLNNDLNTLKSNFLNLLKSRTSLEVETKIFSNWEALSVKDFFKEIEKQKVKLSLNNYSEWLQYFEEQRNKALEIKKQIEETDKQIDNMVFELYELTEEEIKIVGG